MEENQNEQSSELEQAHRRIAELEQENADLKSKQGAGTVIGGVERDYVRQDAKPITSQQL